MATEKESYNYGKKSGLWHAKTHAEDMIKTYTQQIRELLYEVTLDDETLECDESELFEVMCMYSLENCENGLEIEALYQKICCLSEYLEGAIFTQEYVKLCELVHTNLKGK